jgi:uncharacterized protein (DUF1800 family)
LATIDAFIAASRFGMGARPGELAQLSGDPRGALRAQLASPNPPVTLAGLPSSADALGELADLLKARRDDKRTRADAGAPPPVSPVAGSARSISLDGSEAVDAKTARSPERVAIRKSYLADAAARTMSAATSDSPFVERLVRFWSNHFTVSISRPVVAGLVGPFEREAIRPNVTGRFGDLLAAATFHPAMLIYLDNARSIGPNSTIGLRRDRGINENHARELLELHTLGVAGGYGQGDVEALARILSGWTVLPDGFGLLQGKAPTGARFEARMHEPGAKTLLGQAIAEGGADEATGALAMLARHPATARHVADKLARHFIADEPPPVAVERIAATFLASDGDLSAVSQCLIDQPEAWVQSLPKARSADDYVIAALRATEAPAPDPEKLVRSLFLLGQGPFAAPSPAGWGDRLADWISPEALMRRIAWARIVADKLNGLYAASDLIEASLGPVADGALRQQIASAGSPDDLLLLLASPAFQRR